MMMMSMLGSRAAVLLNRSAIAMTQVAAPIHRRHLSSLTTEASGIQRVCVVGAGTLGAQVAVQTALRGFEVSVLDVSQESLDRCQEAHRAIAKQYVTRDASPASQGLERALFPLGAGSQGRGRCPRQAVVHHELRGGPARLRPGVRERARGSRHQGLDLCLSARARPEGHHLYHKLLHTAPVAVRQGHRAPAPLLRSPFCQRNLGRKHRGGDAALRDQRGDGAHGPALCKGDRDGALSRAKGAKRIPDQHPARAVAERLADPGAEGGERAGGRGQGLAHLDRRVQRAARVCLGTGENFQIFRAPPLARP